MNKKIVCVLLGVSMLAFLSPLHAQQEDYLPEGKSWSMLSVTGPARWTYTVSIGSEVERCGHTWKRSRTDEQEFLLLRQEGKKIWALYPYDDGGLDTVPFLMFDFGLKEGDMAHLYVDTTRHIDDVWVVEDVFDSVFELEQEPRHCQRVYLMKRPETKDIWVEGIGSLTNGMTYSPSSFARGPSELICVQKATGDIVYHNKKYSYCYIDDTIVSETYTGTLVLMPNPATEIPSMPGLVMGLQCDGKQYILSKIGWFWDDDYIKIGGVRYEEGDSVEIKGVLSTHIDLLNRTYFELEIGTIRKITPLEQQEDYLPEGKSWSVLSVGWPPLLDSGRIIMKPENMRVEGEVDTLGFVWKRIVRDNGNPLLYRQDGQKIYGYSEFDSIYLRFDFGLQKGDTVQTYTFMPKFDYYVVDSVFESTFGQEARKRKCLAVHRIYREIKDIWVEGIGSLTAGMEYFQSSLMGGRPSLLCVEENGINLYRNPEYNTCRVPAHLSYDYSVQKWSVLCREANDTRHTELLYFKENGRKKWNRAYRATKEDFSDERPCGWYYQDVLQVYFKENENDTAALLYDFCLEKGESVLCAGGILWMVDGVYYNANRRSLRMISESGETDVWVEGIGSLKTGFFPVGLIGDFAATELLCTQAETSRGQVYTYQNERYNSCYIVEETGTEQTEAPCAVVQYDASQQSLVIESDVKIDRLEVFDAQGRGVLKANNPAGSVSVARLPRGLYLYRLTAAGTTLSGKFVR